MSHDRVNLRSSASRLEIYLGSVMFLYSTDVLVEVIAQCGWVIEQWFIIDSGLDRQSKQDNQKVYQSKKKNNNKKNRKAERKEK